MVRQIEASMALFIAAEEDPVAVLKSKEDKGTVVMAALSKLYRSVRSARLVAVLQISLMVGGNGSEELAVKDGRLAMVWETW